MDDEANYTVREPKEETGQKKGMAKCYKTLANSPDTQNTIWMTAIEAYGYRWECINEWLMNIHFFSFFVFYLPGGEDNCKTEACTLQVPEKVRWRATYGTVVEKSYQKTPLASISTYKIKGEWPWQYAHPINTENPKDRCKKLKTNRQKLNIKKYMK